MSDILAKEAKCGCGKTSVEHESNSVLTMHHYWYFHSEYMEGCTYCKKAYVLSHSRLSDEKRLEIEQWLDTLPGDKRALLNALFVDAQETGIIPDKISGAK
jgi:hypothetical protein